MKNNSLISKSCHVEKGELFLCSGLQAVTEIDCRKGVKTQLLLNFKTGEETYVFVLHSGDYVKNGLVMNYCPFCGKDILSHTPIGKQKAKGE
jgi:hypothetical protein